MDIRVTSTGKKFFTRHRLRSQGMLNEQTVTRTLRRLHAMRIREGKRRSFFRGWLRFSALRSIFPPHP